MAKKSKPYTHFIVDNNVYFTLRGRAEKEGINAIISEDKWPYVKQYQWYLGKSGYPVCYELGNIQLHRFIYTYILNESPPPGMFVDHIDSNKLNNTNQNLRLATPQENSFNKKSKNNRKGVRKISDNNYSATIVKDGVKREIKNIPTEIQAAEIYNLMAEELFGQFASLNEIN